MSEELRRKQPRNIVYIAVTETVWNCLQHGVDSTLSFAANFNTRFFAGQRAIVKNRHRRQTRMVEAVEADEYCTRVTLGKPV